MQKISFSSFDRKYRDYNAEQLQAVYTRLYKKYLGLPLFKEPDDEDNFIFQDDLNIDAAVLKEELRAIVVIYRNRYNKTLLLKI